MSTERDVSADTAEPTNSPPRLTPPPRLVVPPPSDARRSTATRSATRSALATWLTIAFFGALVLAAVTVFVVLPDWVRDRQQSAAASVRGTQAPAATNRRTTAPATTAPEPTRSPPAEDAVEPVAKLDAAGPAAPAAEAPGATAARTAPPSRPATGPAWARQHSAAKRDFEDAMSAGLSALDREDFTAAREAFARAAELRPGSPQSADGLARAETGARLSTISTSRQEALAAEAQENWLLARQRYQAVLEIDPTVEFALDGQARAGRRAELTERIDFHIANPGRLAADEVLQEAQAILEQAAEIEPPGPRLQQQRERLAKVVAAFSTPVTATLESDQLTEVVVYKVGRLGTFDRHALDLRPGTYTVVGSRRGFRDVRRKLVIEPGVAPRTLAIRCEEKI